MCILYTCARLHSEILTFLLRLEPLSNSSQRVVVAAFSHPVTTLSDTRLLASAHSGKELKHTGTRRQRSTKKENTRSTHSSSTATPGMSSDITSSGDLQTQQLRTPRKTTDPLGVQCLISKVYRKARQGSLADMESKWVTNHAERFDSC